MTKRNRRTSVAVNLFKTISDNPGLFPKQLGRLIGKTSGYIHNTLPSLEIDGLYISEDDQGRLYPMENNLDE